MPRLNQLLYSLAVLVMASNAQSTTALLTAINSDLTSSIQTSYSLTGTLIATATGSPPPVVSHTINAASTVASPTSTSSSSASSPMPLSVPAIAGIAAGGALLLVGAIILITFLCIKRRQKPTAIWPEITTDKSIPATVISPRRPSSAATLVAPPAPYVHSKGSMDSNRAGGGATLHHSKSIKSSRSSVVLARVSEESHVSVVQDDGFVFDFGLPPVVEITPPEEHQTAAAASTLTSATPPPQMHDETLQKLIADKSLPCSPWDENGGAGESRHHRRPTNELELNPNITATFHRRDNTVTTLGSEWEDDSASADGRPRSSIYSTNTTGTHSGMVRPYPRDSTCSGPWGGGMARDRRSYF